MGVLEKMLKKYKLNLNNLSWKNYFEDTKFQPDNF